MDLAAVSSPMSSTKISWLSVISSVVLLERRADRLRRPHDSMFSRPCVHTT